MGALDHLQPSCRAAAGESAEARIRMIRTDRWIGYARAREGVAAIEDLLTFPKRMRMPNLALIGPTNNGKTMIVERFRRNHPHIEAGANPTGMAVVPVLKVQMPAGADERRLFGAILEALGLPDMGGARIVAVRQDAAMRVMRAANVQLLILDEVHNLLSGTRDQQRRVLNLLRWLGNELQVPLVAVGTAEALRALQSDEQLANRFEPFPLPPWEDGEEFRSLLSTLESVLPLRRPSQLAGTVLAQKILSMSEGILGEIVTIISRAAIQAVMSEAEAINTDVLNGTRFIPPSERRRIAV